jgi:hypothetical protein
MSIALGRLRMLLAKKGREGAEIRPFNAYANWYCFANSVSTACT